jgi:hypothetical protein
VRRADAGSAATALRPAATLHHEVRGERRGEEGAAWLYQRRRDLRRGLGLGAEMVWLCRRGEEEVESWREGGAARARGRGGLGSGGGSFI